jgi:MFS transporter, putative metabolite:H+ symporter
MKTDLLETTEVSSGPIFSLDEILEKIPLGYFHYRLLVVCGMSFMADAMEVTLLSFISTCAGADWDLADSEIALIASIVFVGVLVGSLFWGPFADRFGRRYAFIFGLSLPSHTDSLTSLSVSLCLSLSLHFSLSLSPSLCLPLCSVLCLLS